jgi:hypothetical protein
MWSGWAGRAGKAGRLSKDDRECTQLVSRIRAELVEIEKAETRIVEIKAQIEQRYAAVGKALHRLKGLKPEHVPWEAYLKDRGVPLRQSQADLYIRVYQGRTTAEAVREQSRARVLDHRSALQEQCNADSIIDSQGETGSEQSELMVPVVNETEEGEQVTVWVSTVPPNQVKALEWPSHDPAPEPLECESILDRLGSTPVAKVGATLDEILANSSVKLNELSGLGAYLRAEFDGWHAKIQRAIDSRAPDRVEPPRLH